ncbi:MAG TPA: hypothetical protein VMQ60_05675 [Acidobacteriaceae bacterium]|jgi:hypothetical protein|nr:hypothetical protein [Acidobacteriaceae bacterium]
MMACVAQISQQPNTPGTLVDLDHPASSKEFAISANGHASAIYVAPGIVETVRVAAEAFAADVELVTGAKPRLMTLWPS